MGNVKGGWGGGLWVVGGWVAGWCSGQQLPTGAPVARNSVLGGKRGLGVVQRLWLSNFINTFIIPRHSAAQVAPEDGNQSGDPHFPPQAPIPPLPLPFHFQRLPPAVASHFPAGAFSYWSPRLMHEGELIKIIAYICNSGASLTVGQGV